MTDMILLSSSDLSHGHILGPVVFDEARAVVAWAFPAGLVVSVEVASL